MTKSLSTSALTKLAVVSFLLATLCTRSAVAEKPLWDLNWLLTIDPMSLTDHDLLARAQVLEQKYKRFNQYNGIQWVARYADPHDPTPTYFGSGSDSSLFTGFYLAAATYRFMISHKEADLNMILETLKGLHILTHISGIPGVIARNAFPVSIAPKWRFPQKWQFRINQGFVYESPENIPNVLAPSEDYPQMIFYTKGTRDQLTGMLFGLSVALANLRKSELDRLSGLKDKITKCIEIIDIIGTDIFQRLKSKRFKIKDHRNTTGTTASKVSGLLKLQLIALYKEILKSRGSLYSPEYAKITKVYRRQLWTVLIFGGIENFIQPLVGDYYAWNLRIARIFSVWVLEDDPHKKRNMVAFTRRRIWRYVKHHGNPHFTFLFNRMKGQDFVNLEEAVLSLKHYYFRPMRSWSSPLTGKERIPNVLRRLFRADKDYIVPAQLRRFAKFFLWHKDPYKVDKEADKLGLRRATGLSYLLPYWMGRYFGFLPAP